VNITDVSLNKRLPKLDEHGRHVVAVRNAFGPARSALFATCR
jgi:hypothetical protein